MFASVLTAEAALAQRVLMAHLLNYENVAQYLSFVLRSRKDGNPAYSLRAFAKDLGVAPSTLSEVISGTKGISQAMSRQLMKRLQLSPEEAGFFQLLADPGIKRASSKIEQAKQALLAVRNRKVLSLEVFQVIAEWQHMAILEAIKKSEWRKDLHQIAGRLGISPTLMTESLRRLRKLGFINANNEPLRTGSSQIQDGPRQAVIAHHQSLLRKALAKLDEPMDSTCEFQSAFLIFNRKQIDSVRERIRQFQAELTEEFGLPPGQETLASGDLDIYCLASQFFSLTSELPASVNSSVVL